MKQFDGFPARMKFTSVPNVFFSNLLPDIDDINELKITLHIFRVIYGKKGYPRFVTYSELLGDEALVSGLQGVKENLEQAVSDALDKAVKRGTILRLELEGEKQREDAYFLNTETDRRAVERIKDGELVLQGLKKTRQTRRVADAEPQPDIYTLYEENVGILSPIIADKLKDAEEVYPEAWIRDAIKEAVNQNKRNWGYIEAILKRWSAEGKDDGTHRRDSKTGAEKYGKQKYRDIIKR